MLQSSVAFALSCLGREQMSEGGTHAEVGPKPKLSLSGGVTKEEEITPCSCTSRGLNSHDQLGKSHICGIPE